MANKPLRIVFWNEAYLPCVGGVEIFTERLGRGLIQRGHEVFVVADRIPEESPESECVNGITVCRVPFRAALESVNDPVERSNALQRLAQITKVVTEFKERILPDIVHVNFYGPSAYFHLSTARSLPTKTVVTFHNLLTANAGHDGLVQALLKKATAVAAVSPAGARNIELAMGYPRQRISIIAPGVPSDMFAPAQGGRPGLPTVIFIGRLVDDKGADIAVRAMQFLKGKATLKIVGDGPERPKLENLARQLSLEDSVSFAGQVGPDQRRQILADAFVMVVPSRWEEPFGTVAAEGALSSLPVIATRRGGLPETVKDRETGIIIPPEDPPALVAALRSLLDDPTLAETMGRAGRSRALREFSLEETVNRYETLYFKACTDTH